VSAAISGQQVSGQRAPLGFPANNNKFPVVNGLNGARVYLSNNQSIPVGVATRIAFDTKDYDTNNNFDVVTNHRYTAPVLGYYLVTFTVLFTTTTNPQRIISYIYKNGSVFSTLNSGTSNNLNNSIFITDIIRLIPGDYIEGVVYQDGVGVHANGWSTDTWMTIHQF
jgi:hypothetical protein